MNIVKFELYKPSLKDVAEAIRARFAVEFGFIDISVVDCPDTTQKPYMLAGRGICGSPSLIDVGGVEYLLPLAQKEKVYNIKEIVKQTGMSNALVIGAGAGPRAHIGTNCEMMPNLLIGENENISSHIAKLNKNNECELLCEKTNTDMCLLANLFVSEGKPGKVLRVIAKERYGCTDFIGSIRTALAEAYKEKPVGMGGVFIIKKGNAKLHIMPDYSETPLNSNEDVNNWLKFFDTPAPLTCLSTFVSADPGLNLRVEHTHCFSDHGVGGHYHIDTTPDIVEYEGYFNVAEFLYRVDQPPVRHNFGRD